MLWKVNGYSQHLFFLHLCIQKNSYSAEEDWHQSEDSRWPGQFKLTKTGYQDIMQPKEGERTVQVYKLKMEKRTVQVN